MQTQLTADQIEDKKVWRNIWAMIGAFAVIMAGVATALAISV